MPDHSLQLSIPCADTITLALLSECGRSDFEHIWSIEPGSGKPGTVVTAKGTGLSKASVADIYFSDRRLDLKAQILDQTDSTLRFTVPAAVRPGRQKILLLTSGRERALLEQPVSFHIES